MISVFVSKTWKGAEVLIDNIKTLWVSLPDGRIIKRHKRKHRMRKYVEPVYKEFDPDRMVVKATWWRRFWCWLTGVTLITTEGVE